MKAIEYYWKSYRACSAVALTLVALAATVTPAKADDDISLGVPAYGGTGCPAGSASATLSPDNKTLSILFDSYVVEAGRTTGKSIDRKSCNVAIPVHVPQGYSVSIIQVDYRGFNAIPMGGSSQFNVEYFFAGSQGPRVTKNFTGPQSQDYLISNALLAQSLVWSPCGADVTLRSNSSMMVKTNRSGEQTLATVDSADISAGLIYTLQWRKCQPQARGGYYGYDDRSSSNYGGSYGRSY